MDSENVTLESGIRQSPTYDRRREHTSDALLLLERLRLAAREGRYPSTADLQDERVYGLRPVNRIGDLKKGKYNRTRYDIERLDCPHGVCRWRLYEPARPGYPKHRQQTVLPLESGYIESPQIQKARRSAGAWKAQPIAPVKSWNEIVAERDRRMSESQAAPVLVLTP